MRTRQKVTAIIAELCIRAAPLFPQSRTETILFGSYGWGWGERVTWRSKCSWLSGRGRT